MAFQALELPYSGPFRAAESEESGLTQTGRFIGLAATGAMFLFSAYMYQRTGDWVAAVFAVGSLGYGVFFFNQGRGGK